MTKAYTSPENGGNTYHSRDKRKKRIPSVSRLRRGDKFLIVLILLAIAGKLFLGSDIIGNAGPDYLKKVTVPDWIDIQLIDTDGASRRGTDLKNFNDIVVHYVANPGSTAQQNRDYFNSPDSSVSAHFVIGLEGEIIQCIPLWEISSASNQRNPDTISIEVCHPDSTGQFTDASRQSLIRLCSWLCSIGNLNSGNIIRHYDVTGKLCPLYYVKHEDQWELLKEDVRKTL